MIKIIDILAQLLQALFKLVQELIQLALEITGWTKPKGYTATFTPESSILKKHHKGFSIGGRRALDIEKSFQHVLVSAGSGMGKSTTVGIPSLFTLCGQGSVVVLDPSKELFNATAGHYKQQGYRIITLNFSDRTGCYSDGWNPFPENPEDLPNVINNLAQLELGNENKDPFWQLQAGSILITLGQTLYKQDTSQQHMGAVLYLLNKLAGQPDKMDAYMSEHADEMTWTEYLAFQNNSPNVKASVIATAKSILRLWNRPNIQQITSHNSFSIADLRKEKCIAYIQTNAAELVQYSSLIALFFEELLATILAKLPEPNEENIFMLLDEAGIYKINSLPLAVTQARKMRCGIALLVQNDKQIYNLYGREQGSTIISNCYTKMYMTNQPLEMVKELETLSGNIQYEDDRGIMRVRPLISADELRSMSPDQALVLHGHFRPAMVALKPFFKNRKLRKLSMLTPPGITEKLPPDYQVVLPEISVPLTKKEDNYEQET